MSSQSVVPSNDAPIVVERHQRSRRKDESNTSNKLEHSLVFPSFTYYISQSTTPRRPQDLSLAQYTCLQHLVATAPPILSPSSLLNPYLLHSTQQVNPSFPFTAENLHLLPKNSYQYRIVPDISYGLAYKIYRRIRHGSKWTKRISPRIRLELHIWNNTVLLSEKANPTAHHPSLST